MCRQMSWQNILANKRMTVVVKIIQKQPLLQVGEYIETQFYGHVRLYDINQLLNFLHVEANNGNSDIFLSGDGIRKHLNTKML